LTWGRRIAEPAYDGDILLLKQDRMAFAVVWSHGILYINNRMEKVAWCLTEMVQDYYAFRYSRLSGN
jgi:hypothetical protein